jgi:methionyl-tRNA synthetase
LFFYVILLAANKFWEDSRPWTLKGQEKSQNLQMILFATIETVRVLMTALQPIIPKSSSDVLFGLKVGLNERSLAHLDVGSVQLGGKTFETSMDSFVMLQKRNKT